MPKSCKNVLLFILWVFLGVIFVIKLRLFDFCFYYLDEGLKGAFGSMIGSQKGLNTGTSNASNLNAGTKQIFCRTAL